MVKVSLQIRKLVDSLCEEHLDPWISSLILSNQASALLSPQHGKQDYAEETKPERLQTYRYQWLKTEGLSKSLHIELGGSASTYPPSNPRILLARLTAFRKRLKDAIVEILG